MSCIFAAPVVGCQGSGVALCSVRYARLVAVPPLFEGEFGASNICLGCRWCGNHCFVYDSFLEAVSFHGAVVGLLAVAGGFAVVWGCGAFIQGFSVVACDDGAHVWCAAVAQFEAVSVDDFMEVVTPWFVRGEMFVNQLQEFLSQVGGHCCVEGWVVPHYFTFPGARFSWLLLVVEACFLVVMSIL